MNERAEFTAEGQVVWDAAKVKSPDLSGLQGAMFKDRPNLWPGKPRRTARGATPLDGQLAFAFITDNMGQCSGPQCKGKGEK